MIVECWGAVSGRWRRPSGFESSVFQLVISVTLISLFITQALAINSVLDIKGTFPYLIKADGSVTEPRDYMDFDNIYTPNETYRLKQTAQGRNYHLIKAFDFANYYQSDYWHYSDRNDLLRSAQPVANPNKCSKQLDWLERQLNRSGQVLFQPGQQHINLMTVVDSFGHPETATYLGHAYWIGSYHECQHASLDLDQFYYEDCMRLNQYQASKCLNASATAAAADKTEVAKQPATLKFRYCIGKANDVDWPRWDNYVPRISYKVGLCLPETCETISFESHGAQIERVMKHNLPAYYQDRIKLHDMYCLPDDRSPIRQLPTSARVFLTLCVAWLGVLVFATCVYSCYKRHQKDLNELLEVDTRGVVSNSIHQLPNMNLVQVGASNKSLSVDQAGLGHKNECQISPLLPKEIGPTYENKLKNGNRNDASNSKLLQIKSSPIMDLAQTATVNGSSTKNGSVSPPISGPSTPRGEAVLATSNSNVKINETHANTLDLSQKSNIGSSRSSLSAWIADSPLIIQLLRALSIKETLREFMIPPKVLDVPNAERMLKVNLNALDAIKCLCCILVIFGHIVFIHMQHLSNIIHTIELSHEIYPRALIAFFNFVDTFFIISGMLTAYFVFKRFNSKSFSNPVVWLNISLLRLFRLSPVYLLVFWFIKTTSVYITNGPIWDYGTDKNSIKGLCINDHWWKSILYLGNLGSMQPICILPAWSIIVDAQYSLVIPLVIYLIFRNRRAGYLLLLAATIISTTKMTVQLANQTAVKTSDMSKIRLHVYPLISRFAAEFYNNAWNRIGPVAIGVFGGHMLYLYEVGKIRRWPNWMHGYGFKLVLVSHLIIFLLPTIGRFIDDPESTDETDTTIFILSNATLKPIWSVINTIFLLRLITDLRNHSVLARLMSHNIWHCLGKLCFTSYLIHYEIIMLMLKSRQEGLIDPNWSNALREFSVVFLISTAMSYIIYILYEAPINKLIMLALSKREKKLRRVDPSRQVSDNNKQPHIVSTGADGANLRNFWEHDLQTTTGKPRT